MAWLYWTLSIAAYVIAVRVIYSLIVDHERKEWSLIWDDEDKVMCAVMACMLGFLWPLVLAFYLAWVIAFRHPTPGEKKEEAERLRKEADDSLRKGTW